MMGGSSSVARSRAVSTARACTTSKVKVFQTVDEMAKFIKAKLGEYDADDEDY